MAEFVPPISGSGGVEGAAGIPRSTGDRGVAAAGHGAHGINLDAHVAASRYLSEIRTGLASDPKAFGKKLVDLYTTTHYDDVRAQALEQIGGLLETGGINVFNFMVSAISDNISAGMYDAGTLVSLMIAIREVRGRISRLQAKDDLVLVEKTIVNQLKTHPELAAKGIDHMSEHDLIDLVSELTPVESAPAPIAPGETGAIPTLVNRTAEDIAKADEANAPAFQVRVEQNVALASAITGGMIAHLFMTQDGETTTVIGTPYWAGIYTVPSSDLVSRTQVAPTREKVHRIAIVTDSVISVAHKEFVRPKFVKLVDIHSLYGEDTLRDVYEQLFQSEYQKIISIHLHPDIGKTYDMAKLAAAGLNDNVIALNSECNGLGLGLLVHELSDAIKRNYDFDDVLNLAHSFIQKHQYWAYSGKLNTKRNAFWIRDCSSKHKLKLKIMGHKLIVTLHDNLSCVDTFNSQEDAMAHLYELVEAEFKRRDGNIHRIGIEYKTLYQAAVSIRNRLKARYGKRVEEVSLHVAGSATADLLGPDLIGICMF